MLFWCLSNFSTGIFVKATIFSGCTWETYSHKIGNNTFTSSSSTRDNVLEKAIETCKDFDLDLKVLKERAIEDDQFIIDYKCLDINSSEYKKN